LTVPSPTSPNNFTPASASSLKSCYSMPCSITGAPACILTPDERKFSYQRCDAIAIAFSPTISFGRPGICTSLAEISVVTPPCNVESIQCNCCWRGVQSPTTG